MIQIFLPCPDSIACNLLQEPLSHLDKATHSLLLADFVPTILYAYRRNFPKLWYAISSNYHYSV